MAALITTSPEKAGTKPSFSRKPPYRLQVVPFQLGFDFSPTSPIFCIGSWTVGPRFLDADGDVERDQRSTAEWIDAVVSYLEFRAGSKWRRGKQVYRQSSRYWEYLQAVRLINEQQLKEQPVCNCAAHCLPRYGRRALKPVPAPRLLYPGDKHVPDIDVYRKKQSLRLMRESARLYREMCRLEMAGQPTAEIRAAWMRKREELNALVEPLFRKIATA